MLRVKTNFWGRSLLGEFLFSFVFLDFEQKSWTFGKKLSAGMTNVSFTCWNNHFKAFWFLKKIVFNKFLRTWEKEVWTFSEFFSPRSVKIQFMCPEEVFRKNFLEENFIFFGIWASILWTSERNPPAPSSKSDIFQHFLRI